MTVDPMSTVLDEDEAASGADEAVDSAQKALKESLAAAERSLMDAARTAERVIRDGIEAVKAQSRAYTGTNTPSLDEAQRYVVERVKERPVTAALAGLGVGFLLGVLLSARGK